MGEDSLRKKGAVGNSLAVQWLRLHASTTGGMGLIPGQGTKILHATQCGQKKKKKVGCCYQKKEQMLKRQN